MTTEPEWGPWIDHDGRGCPCVGQYVQVVYDDGSEKGAALDHIYWRYVIRYRVRL